MRTTLDIDDDVLAAAKELALRERSSAGHVLSRLARAALTGHAGAAHAPGASAAEPAAPVYASGFRPFASRGSLVTLADVERVRDEEGV
jgi:Arc/MetJ family transcription regulator